MVLFQVSGVILLKAYLKVATDFSTELVHEQDAHSVEHFCFEFLRGFVYIKIILILLN